MIQQFNNNNQVNRIILTKTLKLTIATHILTVAILLQLIAIPGKTVATLKKDWGEKKI